MKSLLKFKEFLNENLQLADKEYFKKSKLSNEEREEILRITNGDNYTKLITDFYYYYFKEDPIEFTFGRPSDEEILKRLKDLYNDVENYNKNVFPLVEYDIYKPKNVKTLIHALEDRREIIKNLNKLPSIAKRNLKNDIRKKRNSVEIRNYKDNFNYFMGYYNLLSNRDEDVKLKIIRKMFKSDTTLNDLLRFVEDNSNLLGGVEFTKKDIEKIAKNQEDLDIIYDKDNILICSGIYYNDPERELQFNLLYNVIGERIFIIGFDAYPDIYEMPRNILDFSFSKMLTDHLELKIGIGDILNQEFLLLQDANNDGVLNRACSHIGTITKARRIPIFFLTVFTIITAYFK